MAAIMTEWESTGPLPDEEHLKALWHAEIESLERSLAEGEELSRRREASMLPLMEASGLSQGDISERLEESADRSRRSLEESEPQLAKSPIDFEALHEQELSIVLANAERMEGHNPGWGGVIRKPLLNGYLMWWGDRPFEKPSVTFNPGARRFEPRAHAWGKGWWYEDKTALSAFFLYRLTPPSWGHLHIHTGLWLHGYYSLYSDDEWWKGERALAEVETFVRAHQGRWRSRQLQRRWHMSGDELNPTRYGRIDRLCEHIYAVHVSAGADVHIMVGVHLRCEGRASGGRALLDFSRGADNYVYSPYVFWFLHR